MMEVQEFTRAGGRAHGASLIAALTPLLAVANVGSFHLKQAGGQIIVRQEHFDNVDLAAVQAAVDAAPARDADTDATDATDNRALKALARTAWEHGNAAITWAQFKARFRELYKQG